MRSRVAPDGQAAPLRVPSLPRAYLRLWTLSARGSQSRGTAVGAIAGMCSMFQRRPPSGASWRRHAAPISGALAPPRAHVGRMHARARHAPSAAPDARDGSAASATLVGAVLPFHAASDRRFRHLTCLRAPLLGTAGSHRRGRWDDRVYITLTSQRPPTQPSHSIHVLLVPATILARTAALPIQLVPLVRHLPRLPQRRRGTAAPPLRAPKHAVLLRSQARTPRGRRRMPRHGRGARAPLPRGGDVPPPLPRVVHPRPPRPPHVRPPRPS
jgi:hypothetical protein